MYGFFLVALGGAIGACLRYGLGLSGSNGALATLMVNIIGSFLLGILVTWGSMRHWPDNSPLWLFAAIGLLGALTTFSAFSRETVYMLVAGEPGRALLYIAANTMGSIVSFALGLFLFRVLLE